MQKRGKPGRSSNPQIGFLPSLIPMTDADGEPRLSVTDLVIVPDGDVKLADGKTIRMDATVAGSIINEFNRRAVHVPVDFDHQSVYGPPKGQPAPACGWIKHRSDGTGLRYVKGQGLLASEVEWGSDAAHAIHNKQYRYSSPVLIFRKDGSTWLHSFALTNKPLTLGATELKAASERLAREDHIMADTPEDTGVVTETGIGMILGQITAALDIKVDSTDPVTVLQAILDKVKGGGGEGEAEEAVASMRKILELGADADVKAIVTAAEQLKVLASGASDVKAMSDRLKTLEGKERDHVVAAHLEKWQRSNPPRINPGNTEQVKHLKAMAERIYSEKGNLTEFDTFVRETLPAAMPASGSLQTGAPPATNRAAIIAASSAELDADPHRHSYVRENWVNQSLVDAGMPGLTAEEKTSLPG